MIAFAVRSDRLLASAQIYRLSGDALVLVARAGRFDLARRRRAPAEWISAEALIWAGTGDVGRRRRADAPWCGSRTPTDGPS